MTIKKFINLALDKNIINVRNAEKLYEFNDLIHNKKSLNQDDLRIKLNKIIDFYKTQYNNPYTILANELGYSYSQIFGTCKGNLNFGFKLAEKVEKRYNELKNEGSVY